MTQSTRKPPTVKMQQVFEAKWQIVSKNGTILQKDITISTVGEALEYVRNYASSHSDWTFEVVPLPK